jgi:hypothetical protein
VINWSSGLTVQSAVKRDSRTNLKTAGKRLSVEAVGISLPMIDKLVTLTNCLFNNRPSIAIVTTSLILIVLGLIGLYLIFSVTEFSVNGSIIDLSSTSPTITPSSATINFSAQYGNLTNASLSEYTTSAQKSDQIILAINEILGQDYEPVEPLDEEELAEEEPEEEESSSNSDSDSSSSDSDSGAFVPQPGDNDTFPDDTEEPQPQPQQPQPQPNDGNEDNDNDNNNSNGDNTNEAEDSTE